LQVIVNTSNFIFQLSIASHSYGRQTVPEGAWLRHVIHFKFQSLKDPSEISVKFLTGRLYLMLPKGRHITPWMDMVVVTWLF